MIILVVIIEIILKQKLYKKKKSLPPPPPNTSCHVAGDGSQSVEQLCLHTGFHKKQIHVDLEDMNNSTVLRPTAKPQMFPPQQYREQERKQSRAGAKPHLLRVLELSPEAFIHSFCGLFWTADHSLDVNFKVTVQ